MNTVVVKEFLPLEIEALSVGKDPLSCELEIQGNKIEQVITFKYLGTETTSNGALQSQVLVQHEAHKPGRFYRLLKDSIWWNK
jgi:hypothetical protein